MRSNESIGWWEVLERQDVRRHIAATQIVIMPSAKLLSMETLLRVMEDEEEWPYTTYICLNLGLCVYIIIRVNFYEFFGSATFLLVYFRLSYGYTMRVSMRTYTYSRMAHEIYSIILFYKETSLNLKILIFNIQLTKKLSYFFHNFNRQFFL